ncbi:formate/nitrite transporter family protein [Celerinatantimonas sp. MCCC 1A17872]|uniref:formate/nitrite transporter family protein n=1 Tax=Celerinatantimonas sp. MCCC 1A17872 TaxID=3177514 RepID=UPI0038C45F9F
MKQTYHPDAHDQNESEGEESRIHTGREKERLVEDRDYVPVIIKRTDQSRRHPDDILESAIHEGLEQLQRPFFSLFLSSMAAGLILGFTAMSVAIVQRQVDEIHWLISARLITAFVYPLGFVMCIMSGTQLFTEHTATAVYPVLDRRTSWLRLVRLWAIVLLGNIVGAFIIACLLDAAEPVIHAHQGYIAIGHHLVGYSARALIVSAILAGWLMALGAWLIMSTAPMLSQIVVIYIVTFVIGIGGLHHSIAGSVEIFAAYLIGSSLSLVEVARFIALAVIGNLIGGSIFVGVLNYAHIRKTQSVE